jgi:uncharacterized YccA/Bax inhibitor family protein
MLQSSNPMMKNSGFRMPQRWDDLDAPGGRGEGVGMSGGAAVLDASAIPSTTMTVRGTAAKAAISLVFCALTAVVVYGWMSGLKASGASLAPAYGVMLGGTLVGLVLALVLMFKPLLAAFLTLPYAVCQGAFVGGLSYIAATSGLAGKGIGAHGVFTAVAITFGIFAAMLALFGAGFRIRGVFAKMLIVAVAGIALTYVVNLVLNMVGVTGLNVIHSASPIGIGFSLLVVGLASFTLVMDMQFIEDASAGGTDKRMEWYGAFALTSSLVWLYIEVLRLISKLRSSE